MGVGLYFFFFFFDWLNNGQGLENLFSSSIGHPPPGVSEGRAGWLAPVCLSLLVVAAVINISVCACYQRCDKRAVWSQYERVTLKDLE